MEPINWKDSEELDRWLSTKKPSTQEMYLDTWRLFKPFTETELGRTFEDAELATYLIDEIEEEEKKPRRERGEVQRRLERWGKWMREEKKQSPNTSSCSLTPISQKEVKEVYNRAKSRPPEYWDENP